MINEHPPAVGCLYPRPLSGRPVSIAVGGGGGVVWGQSEKIELSRSGQKKIDACMLAERR